MPHANVEKVLNALGIAVFIVDADQTILFRNEAAVSLFGPNVRGRKLSSFVPNKRCIRAVEAVIEGQEAARVSVTLQLAVPTSFRMVATRLEPDQPGGEVNVAVSFEDVTHVLEAEQMRSDFVANVSHELRSPLTALSGFIETLQDHARHDPEATNRFLELMAQEAGRMRRLIDDLLSLSKVQGSERYAPTEAVALRPIVEGVIAALGHLFEEEGVSVEARFDPALRPVYGDAHELGQVFRNLLENAAKYSREGARIIVEAVPDPLEPDMMRIAVSDEGEGIPPEHIGRLTERFYRIDKGRSRSKGGTGLGLAIVKHILTRHRGRLRIESEVGRGSTFTVLLPAAGGARELSAKSARGATRKV